MKRLLLATIAGSLLLAGCAKAVVEVRPTGKKIEKSIVLGLKPGTTTKQEILDAFGEPGNISGEGTQEVFSYVYKEELVPVYANTIENKVMSKTRKSTLEITLKDGTLYQYKFSSGD